jgi:hypothetical protein
MTNMLAIVAATATLKKRFGMESPCKAHQPCYQVMVKISYHLEALLGCAIVAGWLVTSWSPPAPAEVSTEHYRVVPAKSSGAPMRS